MELEKQFESENGTGGTDLPCPNPKPTAPRLFVPTAPHSTRAEAAGESIHDQIGRAHV